MKIAVCSPFNDNSAIGRVAIDTADELASRGHLIDLISIEQERPSSYLETATPPTFWLDQQAATQLQSAEMVIVHLGDNYAFHAGAIHILKHWRCVGVFHDANLYGMFRMWAFDGRSEADGVARHDEMLTKFYGQSQVISAHRSDVSTHYDMIPWLAAQCATALAHSTFYVPKLEAACAGPLFATPLTYSARPHLTTTAAREEAHLRILTVGHVNSNKCCDAIIQAIGASSLRNTAEYRIAGPATDNERERLTALAMEHKVRLTLLGRVSDDVLAEELHHADIVSCLRRPVLEGASASAIEAMLSGRPIIVVDAGFYADIADDAAVKVPADFEIDQLRAALDRLAGSADLRKQYGAAGQAWATENCDVRVYVDKLEEAVRAAIAIEPFLDVAKAYAVQLQSLGLDENDPAWRNVASSLQTLVET